MRNLSHRVEMRTDLERKITYNQEDKDSDSPSEIKRFYTFVIS